MGHLARVCREVQERNFQGRRAQWVTVEQSENNSGEGTSWESEELGLYQIHQVKKVSTPPVRVELRVNSKPLRMEVVDRVLQCQ